MKTEYQISLILGIWVLFTIVNGIRDQLNSNVAFWKRPLTLFVAWAYAGLCVLIAFGGQILYHALESHGFEIFGFIIGFGSLLCLVAAFCSVGCSFFIPFADSYELEIF